MAVAQRNEYVVLECLLLSGFGFYYDKPYFLTSSLLLPFGTPFLHLSHD